MAFVSRGGGAEQQNETAGIGETVEFDPNDPTSSRSTTTSTSGTLDQRAELAEAMAQALVPHAWDDSELIVPEVHEDSVDAILSGSKKRSAVSDCA